MLAPPPHGFCAFPSVGKRTASVLADNVLLSAANETPDAGVPGALLEIRRPRPAGARNPGLLFPVCPPRQRPPGRGDDRSHPEHSPDALLRGDVHRGIGARLS